MSDLPEPVGTAPRSRKKWVLIGAAAVLVLALGAGGAYWWTGRDPVEAAEPADPKAIDVTKSQGIVSFEPFLVNLADRDAPRFMRVSLQLVVSDPGVAAELTENQVALTRARSAILELLTQQTSEVVVTSEGKAALKASIGETASAIFAPIAVIDVLFSDFVVQF